jgi:hypothetical protein
VVRKWIQSEGMPHADEIESLGEGPEVSRMQGEMGPERLAETKASPLEKHEVVLRKVVPRKRPVDDQRDQQDTQ